MVDRLQRLITESKTKQKYFMYYYLVTNLSTKQTSYQLFMPLTRGGLPVSLSPFQLSLFLLLLLPLSPLLCCTKDFHLSIYPDHHRFEEGAQSNDRDVLDPPPSNPPSLSLWINFSCILSIHPSLIYLV